MTRNDRYSIEITMSVLCQLRRTVQMSFFDKDVQFTPRSLRKYMNVSRFFLSHCENHSADSATM
jgi:hypothetical protein